MAAAIAIAASAGLSMQVHAQSSISTDATIATASPTGAGAVRNLQFGSVTITPGTTKVVDVPAAAAPQSASSYAAEFAYGVDGMAGMDITVTLPTQLTSTVGNVPLAISFSGATHGGHCVTSGTGACTLTPFDPTTSGGVRICSGYKGNGTCKNQVWTTGSTAHMYIGAAITVPPTQVAATYTGTITSYIVQVY